MASRKKKATLMERANKEDTAESIRKELEQEQKAKDTIEWSNVELERSVRAMEANVMQLEAGHHEADDSEVRQKYENQRQLNVQLLEQKRWLEHELEQIKLKIQNEKMHPLPDPFALDWDNLSETELKRLVIQLEKTRSDLKSDLRETEFKLDKEGREFYHADDFVRMYQAEIKNLDRILEALAKTGAVPTGVQLPSTGSTPGSHLTSGGITPGGGPGGQDGSSPTRRKPSSLSPPLSRRVQRDGGGPGSPTKRTTPGSPTKRTTPGSPTKKAAAGGPGSPTKGPSSPTKQRRPLAAGPPLRKGNTRALPKIDKDGDGKKKAGGKKGEATSAPESSKAAPASPSSATAAAAPPSRKDQLDTVDEDQEN